MSPCAAIAKDWNVQAKIYLLQAQATFYFTLHSSLFTLFSLAVTKIIGFLPVFVVISRVYIGYVVL